MASEKINPKYYVNVARLMQLHNLPRPQPKRRKVSVLVDKGEWLPVVDGSTGKVVKI